MAPVPIPIEPNPVKRYSIPNIIVTTAINVIPEGSVQFICHYHQILIYVNTDLNIIYRKKD